MKNRIRKKIILIPVLIILGTIALALFGWLVMYLWNAVLVPATGAGLVTYWQAIGILVLSRILVGGFGGGNKRHDSDWYWKRKWMRMTPDEKAQFREKWRQRFGSEFFDEQKEQSGPELQQ